jgi:hypothetical protein
MRRTASESIIMIEDDSDRDDAHPSRLERQLCKRGRGFRRLQPSRACMPRTIEPTSPRRTGRPNAGAAAAGLPAVLSAGPGRCVSSCPELRVLTDTVIHWGTGAVARLRGYCLLTDTVIH